MLYTLFLIPELNRNQQKIIIDPRKILSVSITTPKRINSNYGPEVLKVEYKSHKNKQTLYPSIMYSFGDMIDMWIEALSA